MFAKLRNWQAVQQQKLADQARDRGDWSLAAQHYKRVIAIDSERAEIFTQLGHALKEQGNWREAEGAYRTAIAKNPVEPDPYLHLGRILICANKVADGESILNEGLLRLSHLPNSNDHKIMQWQMLIGVADAARSAKNWQKASDYYRKALNVGCNDAGIWVQLAHAVKEKGDLPGSEAAYRQAITLDPNNVDAYLHLTHLLTSRMRVAEQAARSNVQLLEEGLSTIKGVRKTFEDKANEIGSSPLGNAPRSECGGKPSDSTEGQSAVGARVQTKSGFRLHEMPVARSIDLLAALDHAAKIGQPVFVHLPTISWDVSLFQRPQHMALAMARQGALSIYFTYEDLKAEHRLVNDNCWLANPSVDLLGKLRNTIISFYSTMSTNEPDLIGMLRKNNTIVYEYIDHVDEAISGDAVPELLRLKEFAFSGGADVIAVSAKALEDEAKARVDAGKIVLVQNGTDYEHYRVALLEWTEPPARLAELKAKHKSIVGYFGALAPWIWHEMINELTALRPDLGFVFVGPDYYGGMDKIDIRDNVLLTGAVPYAKLPMYAKHFDVCTIPFRPGEIARTTSPLKLFEYFSLEKPVVVTDQMNECTVYPEVFRAGNVTTFSDALDRAFAQSHVAHFKDRLRKLAMENTWDARASTLLKFSRSLLLENSSVTAIR